MDYIMRKWEKLKIFVKENKKNLIIIGCLLLGVLTLNGVGGMVRGMFIESLDQVNSNINITQNNIVTLRNTIESGAIGNESHDAVITYVGDKVIQAKWETDVDIFIDYISPAFNYDSGTEYDENRQIYINDLGERHLFVVNYLKPFRNCVNQDDLLARPDEVDESFEMHLESNAISMYPIKMTNDFNYTYIAFVEVPSDVQYKEFGAATMIFIVTIDNDVITELDYYAVTRY